MNLHLSSMPGAYPLGNILAASRPYLARQTNPILLYLPAAEAVPKSEYIGTTRIAFKSLAKVQVLDLTHPIPLVDIGDALERATVLYIPGGNTYLLLDRLYRSRVFGLIQARVQAGMPLVGFSAGMVVCGRNILTSNDMNECGCTNFAGFGFTIYNFLAHYPSDDGEDRVEKDNRISEYHKTHSNPVLAVEDDGCVEIDNGGIKVVSGHCWQFEAGREKVLLRGGS
jgi:dipeptidase E